MTTCENCNTQAPYQAHYCYKCGNKLAAEMLVACPGCGNSYPSTSEICHTCGFVFSEDPSDSYTIKYPINFQETSNFQEQIKKRYLEFLTKEIENAFEPDHYDVVMVRYFESGFAEEQEERFGVLAEEIYAIHSDALNNKEMRVDHLLDRHFLSETDQFFDLHCPELIKKTMTEKTIDTTENVNFGDHQMQSLFLDYLNFQEEKEKAYIDLKQMPKEKLKNALNSFVKPSEEEKIMFICDQTIFGSCREGFAMTDRAIYWKAHFKDAQELKYHEITDVQKEKDWILINGIFFNINPSFNLKVIQLLRKLRTLHMAPG